MDLRKTILELNFSKYLQYKITTILIIATIIISILITFLTKQVNIRSFQDVLLIVIVSSILISVLLSFLARFNFHLQNILNELKEINKE